MAESYPKLVEGKPGESESSAVPPCPPSQVIEPRYLPTVKQDTSEQSMNNSISSPSVPSVFEDEVDDGDADLPLGHV